TQAADAETGGRASILDRRRICRAAPLGRLLDREDRSFGEEVLTQMTIEDGIATAEPLENHRRVLLLLVAVVREDLLEVLIVRCVDPLRVPIDGLELLHQRANRAMAVDDGLAHRLASLVQNVGFTHLYSSFSALLLSLSSSRLNVAHSTASRLAFAVSLRAAQSGAAAT